MYYRLNGKTPEPIADVIEWSRSFENDRKGKRVASDDVGPFHISTVFLGLDHSLGDGPPILFESMVFKSGGDWADLDSQRYATYDEAEAGHKALVEKWRNKTTVYAGST